MKNKFWDISKSVVYVKVGIFFIGAVILIFFTLLSVRENIFLKQTYVLKIKFNFAEGLRPSSPVRFCGVDVGEIKKVEVQESEAGAFVNVHAKIDKDVHIPKNSQFFINSLSLLGEKYLEISSPQKIEGYINDGETVEGISPIPLFNIFVTFDKTMKEVSDFVEEGKIKTSFENTLVNMEKASEGVKELVNKLNSNEGTVGKLLHDESLYIKTEEFIEDLKRHPWKLLHKPKETKNRR